MRAVRPGRRAGLRRVAGLRLGWHGAPAELRHAVVVGGACCVAATMSSSAPALAATRVEHLATISPRLATSLRGPVAALVPAG